MKEYIIVNSENDRPKDLTWFITAGGWVCFSYRNQTHMIDYVELLNQRISDGRMWYRYLTEKEIGLIGINLEKIEENFKVKISTFK